MPRILSIWLPQLPLDRRVRQGDTRLSGTFAITAEERNAWRVTHANGAALKAGVKPGQALADARAICPDLLTEPSDPVREELLLRALWRWADALSPRVSLDPPDGLLLDIGGCAHLFGGELEMGRETLTRLSDLQVQARIGIADTKGGAQALARFGAETVNIAAAGTLRQALADLPIAALALPEKLVSELARAGLSTVAQLQGQASAELARRFGLQLTRTLDHALGRAPDPVTPKAADPVYAARMTLPEPIGFVEDLEQVLQRLADQVCARLEADQCGARQFRLTVRCVDTGDHPLAIGFARPCSDPAALLRQFAHPLSQLEIEYGADWFRLCAEHVEPIRLKQTSFGDEAKRADDRLVLIETLGNRIGFDHVRVFRAKDSHVPEHEFEQVEAVQAEPHWPAAPRVRPIRLFTPPEYVEVETPGRPPKAFKWRRMAFLSETAQGPERITPRWFRDEDLRTRDYWKVQTREGRRLWLLNYPGEATEDWYVAGEFA
ncbi:MAG: DNA polymerase Y family protein [Hyphomonadaceae bacterium]|nr:DNA polymerase Y family protein [Hyphomonadaceae bacterium]